MKMNNNYKVFHKIFHISYILGLDFKNFAADFELSEMEAKFMFCIGDGNRKISDLICFFKKHKSTITQKINALEGKKYIKIENSSHDKRERKVTLTKKGELIHQKMLKVKGEYRKKVFKNLTKKDQNQLLELLEKINLEKKHEKICKK